MIKKKRYKIDSFDVYKINISQFKRIISGGFYNSFYEDKPFISISDDKNLRQCLQEYPRSFPCAVKFIDDNNRMFYKVFVKQLIQETK